MRVLLASLPLFACTSASPTSPSMTEAPVKEATPVASEVAAAKQGEFQGEIEFVSIKNGDSPVSAVIRDITGAIRLGEKAEDGVHRAEGALTIPLTAVDSQLEIRDQRIMNVFFHAQETPSASFAIDGVKMPEGNEGAGWVDGTLSIGPYTQDVRGHFLGASQEEGSWTFESGEPMVVSIESLGMGSRLKALMELCGHRSIDDSVEVRAKGLLRF
jgi:hypothetical protein